MLKYYKSMGRRTIISLLVLMLSPVIIYLLWPSDEARVRKLIKQGAAAIEKEDLDRVMSLVSFNYRDDYGLTYILIRKVFEEQFRAMSDIKIEYENLKVQAAGEKATADLDLRVIATIGNNTGYIFGDLRQAAHLKLSLEKEHARWHATKAEGLDQRL